jgi:RNA polymerase sigma factor (sigma-70 family)
MTETDLELVQLFAVKQSQDAFAELVRRHLNLVYSAALRLVRSRELAEEVAQTVFLNLGRQASSLRPDTVLSAWLYRVAQRTAVDVIRQESRRQAREQAVREFNAMQTPEHPGPESADADWRAIEPLLEEAMSALDEQDRAAVLLRYFENLPLREVGRALGMSDDAAQKRVSRALSRLRTFFSRRKIEIGAAGLAAALSASAVQAAPAGLAASITLATTAAGSALLSAATITATRTIAMTTLQKAAAGTGLAIALGLGLYEGLEVRRLGRQNAELQRERVSLKEQLRRQEDRDTLAQAVALLRDENARLQSNSQELPKLRGELSTLRRQTAGQAPEPENPTASAARTWLRNVEMMRAKFEEMPEKKIPELAFLADYDWLQSARYSPGVMETFSEQTWRSRMHELRLTAKRCVAHRLGNALDDYIADHDGNLPSQLSQLSPYYKGYSGEPPTLAPEILNRYELVQSGNLRELTNFNAPIIVESAGPVDAEYDASFTITAGGYLYEGVGLEKSSRGSGAFNEAKKVYKYNKALAGMP